MVVGGPFQPVSHGFSILSGGTAVGGRSAGCRFLVQMVRCGMATKIAMIVAEWLAQQVVAIWPAKGTCRECGVQVSPVDRECIECWTDQQF